MATVVTTTSIVRQTLMVATATTTQVLRRVIIPIHLRHAVHAHQIIATRQVVLALVAVVQVLILMVET